MLKLEVRNINVKSVFKSVILASVIPAIIMMALMIVLIAMIGTSSFENSGGGGLLLTIGYLLFYNRPSNIRAIRYVICGII